MRICGAVCGLQFPIDMSLPWILMSHVLDSKDSFLIQCVYFSSATEISVRQFS